MFVQLVRNGETSESHPFTISSSPEADQLAITPKSVGDFTNSVGETPVGAKAIIDAPYGVFSFHRYDNPRLVFVAGGIGITPFMSMFRSMRDTDTKREVLLIWGNKTEKDILFADELDEIRRSVGTFDIVHVMSHQEDFEGEKGYITEEILRKYVQEFSGKEYFVCGPPVMMNLVDGVLQRVGVTNRRIHMERFAL
jgi:3-phenylpropionate/trans-cinnamate dioxygenase ferredoxin reductase subunit